MKKYFFLVIGVIITVFLFMAFLHKEMYKPNDGQKNGFERKSQFTITRLNEFQFEDEIIDIAGIADSGIYIASKKEGKLFCVNRNLENSKEININVPKNDRMESGYSIRVKYPFAYIMASNMPSVIEYNLITEDTVTYKMQRVYTSSTILTPGNIVIRGFDSSGKNQILKKINLQANRTIEQPNIIERKNDGGMSTSGKLNYDEQTNMVIYVNSYSNKILYLDTNLNLIHLGNTIDTFYSSQAQVRSASEKGKNSFGFASPPRVVNAYSCSDQGKLFIYSKVRADNETDYQYWNSSIIDIYDIKTGHYMGALYIPAKDQKRITRFKINGNFLVVLYNKSVATYKINELLQ